MKSPRRVVPQLSVYFSRRGKPILRTSLRITSLAAPLRLLIFSRIVSCCFPVSSFQSTRKTLSVVSIPSSVADCAIMLWIGTSPSGKTSPQTALPSAFKLAQVLYFLKLKPPHPRHLSLFGCWGFQAEPLAVGARSSWE